MKRHLQLVFCALLCGISTARAEEPKFVIACDLVSGAICNSWELARILGWLPPQYQLSPVSNSLTEMKTYLGAGKVQALGHPSGAYASGLNNKERGIANEAQTVLLTTSRPDSGIVVNRSWFKQKTGKEPEEVRGSTIPHLFDGVRVGMNGCDFPSSPPISALLLSPGTAIKCGTTEVFPGAMTVVGGLNVNLRLKKVEEGELVATNITFPQISILEAQIAQGDPQALKVGILARIQDMPKIPTAGLVVPASFMSDPAKRGAIRELACIHMKVVRFARGPANEATLKAILRKQMEKYSPSDLAVTFQLENVRASWLQPGALSDEKMERVHKLFLETHEKIQNPSLVSPDALTIGKYWALGRVTKFHDFSAVPDEQTCH